MMKFIGRNWEEQNMINNSFARDLPDSEFTEVIRPSAIYFMVDVLMTLLLSIGYRN